MQITHKPSEALNCNNRPHKVPEEDEPEPADPDQLMRRMDDQDISPKKLRKKRRQIDSDTD